jgi:hypothetical protein
VSVEELIEEVRQAGAELRADPPDLVIRPAGRISPELKARLKEQKAEILRELQLNALHQSMKRLEAQGICVAILDDGDMRILRTDEETISAIDDHYTIYSPRDIYFYVQLEPHERRMLHHFKRKFGGITEWRVKP